ncbi:hypothetical protein LINGRAHAP2_LOCUS30779 [Linum grandiflorum]
MNLEIYSITSVQLRLLCKGYN